MNNWERRSIAMALGILVGLVIAVCMQGNRLYRVGEQINALTDQVAAQQHNVDTVIVIQYWQAKWDSSAVVDSGKTYFRGMLGKQGGK